MRSIVRGRRVLEKSSSKKTMVIGYCGWVLDYKYGGMEEAEQKE